MTAAGRDVRVVLVGIGGYAGSYAVELLKLASEGGVVIAGAVDPLAGKAKMTDELRADGVRIHDDLDDFYATNQADLAVISSPIQYHRSQMLTALANGSAVLCEKPLTATIAEAHEMFAAQQASGRFVAMGYQWSFSDAIQSLKRDILAGELGKPLRLQTLCCWPRAISYYGRASWAGRLRMDDGAWVLDGPANNATAHYLHNMLYLLGPSLHTSATPETVQAELYRANAIESYDTAAIRVHTGGGGDLLFLTTHSTQHNRGPVFRFEFEKATVHYDGDGDERIVARFHDGRQIDYGDPGDGPMNKLHQSIECVRTGGPVSCPIEAAIAQTRCINGAHASSATITDLPADLRQIDDPDGDVLIWTEGLAESFDTCYKAALLPEECGDIAWASPGQVINIADCPLIPTGL